jgi:hypothetical protein
MKHKLEEILNLPEYNETSDEFKIDISEDEEDTQELNTYDIQDLQDIYLEIDKIDQSLGTVRGLDMLDSEMDDLANKSLDTFDKLIKMGDQLEDRHIASVYDAASKLMGNAISAKQSKMDRKLKAIQLQIQKAKVDHENRKLDFKIKERRDRGDDARPLEGNAESIEISRTELLRQILSKNINNSKEG